MASQKTLRFFNKDLKICRGVVCYTDRADICILKEYKNR